MSEFFPTCQDIILTVAPGEEEVRAGNAEMLAIISATAAFLVSFDSGGFQIAQAGLSYQRRAAASGARPRFKELRFFNPNAFPIDIEVQISNGDIFDNRAIFGAGAVPVTPAPAAVFDCLVAPAAAAVFDVKRARAASITRWSATVAAGGWPTVSPAAANRRALWIANRGTETVYVSSSGGPSSSGIPLSPGDRIRLETVSKVDVYNPSAVSVFVTGVEELF